MTEIEIDSVSKRFEDHLKVEQNYRIILSGKFGVGKTYFLKKFFESKKSEYNAVFLYPVNYVVSSNEDIFELIKVDIIRQLFTTKEPKKKSTVSIVEKVALFASEKPHHFLKFITSSFKKIVPFLDKVDGVYDAINKLYSEYKIYEKELEGKFQIDEQKLEEFTDSFNDKVGNIFEENFITKTLNEKLIKVRGRNKKNVLVIDDLDRIDPEHIFRILNILSAHNNEFDSKNKFEFDHVLIVCDIENIKNIFYHKYGREVDFDGYIDKFYSTDIFFFTNNDAIKFYIESGLTTGVDDRGFTMFLQFILTSLVDADELSVRKIIKHKYNFVSNPFVLAKQEGLTPTNMYLSQDYIWMVNYKNLFVDSNDLPILIFFKLMTIIYGEFGEFYTRFKKLLAAASKSQSAYSGEDVKDLLQFLALQKHIATNSGDKLFFKLTYGEDLRRQRALVAIALPQVSIAAITYNIDLQWNQNNIYNGQASYFQNSKAVNPDRYQYLSNKPQTSVSAHEIFKAVDEIIIGCDEKGYLKRSGIVFKKL